MTPMRKTITPTTVAFFRPRRSARMPLIRTPSQAPSSSILSKRSQLTVFEFKGNRDIRSQEASGGRIGDRVGVYGPRKSRHSQNLTKHALIVYVNSFHQFFFFFFFFGGDAMSTHSHKRNLPGRQRRQWQKFVCSARDLLHLMDRRIVNASVRGPHGR